MSLFTTVELHFMKILTNQIFNDPKVYQIIVLKDNDYTNIDFVLERITREKPSILINLGESKILGNHPSTNSSISSNSRLSSMFIILLNGNKEQERLRKIDLALKEIIEYSPNSVRPRCLLIHVSKSSLSDADVLNIHQEAWSLKFLDFSIFDYRQNGFIICTYNPFTEELFTIESLNTTESIFPNKFTDMGNYKFKVGYTEIPKFMEMNKHPKTGELKLKAIIDYSYVQTISKVLNFPIQYVHKSFSLVKREQGLSNMLSNSDIDLFPIQFLVGSQIYGNNCTIGRITKDSWYVFIVPVMSAFRFNIPVEWLYFFATVYGFAVACRLLNFFPSNWSAIHILQVFLGETPVRGPEEVKHRIVYLSLVLLSMLYGSCIYSEVLKIKMTSDEVPFDTVEEIRSSGLPVYAGRYFQVSTNGNEAMLERMSSTLTGRLDHSECLKRLERYKDCICFVPVALAEIIIGRYLF